MILNQRLILFSLFTASDVSTEVTEILRRRITAAIDLTSSGTPLVGLIIDDKHPAYLFASLFFA